MEYIKDSASILRLTLEQIQEREKFIEENQGSIIDERGKFNSIFGMSKKIYEARKARAMFRHNQER